MSEEVPCEEQIRRASSPSSSSRTGRHSSKNWLNASTWKESAYLAEPIKRNSPTSTPDRTKIEPSLDFIANRGDETPLDFSMKKRKSTSGVVVETQISTDDDILASADASSATYGLMKAFLERRATSPNRESDSVPTAPSPFGLSNRRGSANFMYAPAAAFPLSLAAAAAAAVVNANSNSSPQQQNSGGSSSSTRRNYFTQQLLHSKSQNALDDFAINNNEHQIQIQANDNPTPVFGACTPSTPPAFYSGVVHSPQNGHQQPTSSLPNRNSQQKIQRPFKAYNPMDPMSALQVGATLAPTSLPFLNAALAPPSVAISNSSPHPLLPNPLTSPATTSSNNALSPLLNAQLLSQYRQYLINAQAAAAVAALRAKSNQHLQQHQFHPPQRHSSQQRQQMQPPHEMTPPIGPPPIGNTTSQSPPQVTSTSHPHTAESSSSASSTGSPPSPNNNGNGNGNGISNPNVSVSVGNNRIRNANLQQSKSVLPDRRISSGSGSGGSSFNGGDEDDEELLAEDDDGISNRTSPTPSTASSTAHHRPGNGDGAGVGSGNGANGASSKGSSRRKGRSLPESLKDDAYWERRRKNNEAAKRSRDARRAKEDEIAIRAALLEQENMRLRIEVAALKAETDKLRQMLLNT